MTWQIQEAKKLLEIIEKKEEEMNSDVLPLLKEFGLQEKYEKLNEWKIADSPELFWNMSNSDLESMLGLEKHSQKVRFHKRFNEIKEEHKKNLEKISQSGIDDGL